MIRISTQLRARRKGHRQLSKGQGISFYTSKLDDESVAANGPVRPSCCNFKAVQEGDSATKLGHFICRDRWKSAVMESTARFTFLCQVSERASKALRGCNSMDRPVISINSQARVVLLGHASLES